MHDTQTELVAVAERASSTGALMLDTDNLDRMYRAAEMMASARVTIPKHLAGAPGDCLAVIMQATQWGMNPFAVAQKTHIVNGTLGYEAQLVNAVISSSSLLTTRISYEWEGDWNGVNGKTDKNDARAVTVSAKLRGEPEPRNLRVSMAQVGDVRNSPNWASDPRQQLAYLATKKWARLHAPDVMLGIYTPDELEAIPERDMGHAEVVAPDAAPATQTKHADAVRQRLADRRGEAVTVPPLAAGPALADVLNAISAASTPDALRAAGEVAKALDTDGQQQARNAYKTRKAELSQSASPTITYAQVADALNKATDLDTLGIASDLIGELADEQQRAELVELFNVRKAELAS